MIQNYGARFDLTATGLPGPIEIIGRKGDESVVKDISHHKWSYKVGLDGLTHQLFNADTKAAPQWSTENLPIHRRMTWYKVFLLIMISKRVMLKIFNVQNIKVYFS